MTVKRRKAIVPESLSTHLVKERTGKAVVTKCGVIADLSSRAPVKVTLWGSEVTCPSCSS